MTENKSPMSSYEEIDLRELILKLIKRWRFIAFVTIVFGVLATAFFLFMKPTYTAKSIISINPSAVISQITPLFLVQSDHIKNEIVTKLNITEKDLPEVKFSTDKIDQTIIIVSATSEKQGLALRTANFWAELAVKSVKDDQLTFAKKVEKARIDLEAADAELSAYLLKNGLKDLAWAELVSITGAGNSSNIAILESSIPLPQISMTQRNEISKIIQSRTLAQWNYSELSMKYLAQTATSSFDIQILNQAEEAKKDHGFINNLLIPLGILSGLGISVIWIMLEDWWKQPDLKEKNNN